MIGMLGIAEAIGNAVGWVLKTLLAPLIKLAFEFILTPLIMLIITIVKYIFGVIFYFIGTFLLKLIDFVEILFRALAGLDSTSPSGMSLELSLDGGTGDILIQIIRSSDIQQAFLSMCIVGLFLLVVTTVFQVIKVEYTTEGAKNAKGPIYQKAFKGLANLMLLPLLVIFGIIFANQLLGLLDKATKVDGTNPTISGLIFVTCASEAFYLEGEQEIEIEGSEKIDIMMSSFVGAIEQFFNSLGSTMESTPSKGFKLGDDEREHQIGLFISQSDSDHEYYDIIDVNTYFNYAEINYMLMIFGGVFVLKSLFFACFGMVNRLYKCAMLFIISPAIIGMTPINEGGLGKWRSAFIGQVLAGYGTIMSINLFFVIVRVLLNIDVKFTSDTLLGENTGGFFTSSLMTMLLKAVFVLAGCLLIEKFSKEIGGYFGAEDAMASGKESAGQIGDLAMKGVKTAAMVGGGGAALALKAAKGAKGLASRLGDSGLSNKIKNSKAVGKIKGKINDSKKDGVLGKVSGGASKVKGALTSVNEGFGRSTRKAKNFFFGASDKDKYLDAKDDFDKLSKDNDTYDKIISHNNKLIEDAELQKRIIDGSDEDEDTKNEKKAALDERIRKADGNVAQATKNKSEITAKMADTYKAMEPYEKKKQTRGAARLANIAGVVGLAEEGKKLIPGNKYLDDWRKAQKSGGEVMGDPFIAAVKNDEYLRGKKVQDFYHDDVKPLKRMVDAQNAAGATIAMVQFAGEAAAMNTKITTIGNDIIDNLRQMVNQLGGFEKGNADEIAKAINNSRLQLENQGVSLTNNDVKNLALRLEGNPQLKFTLDDFKVNFDPNKIQAAVAEALKNGGNTPEAIQEAIKTVFKDIADAGNPQLMKMLTDVITKVMNDIPKG